MKGDWRIPDLGALHHHVEDPLVALGHLTKFALSMLRQNTLEDLLWDIAQNVGDLLGFEDCVVYLLESEGLVQHAAFGIKHQEGRQIRNKIVIPLGAGLVGTVAKTGVPERIPDLSAEPRYIQDEFAGRSELTVPISYEGRVIGVLDSESSQLDGFTETEEALFVAIATLAAPRISSALAVRDRDWAEVALAEAEEAHRLQEKAEQEVRVECLGQLAGGIAHDFDNFLTAILGNVSLARTTASLDENTELLLEAESACERAKGLTKQLLTFARGGNPVKTTGDIVKLAGESFRFALRGSQVALRIEVEGTIPTSSFDSGQISQVFHNLALNTVQAMPQGGQLTVRIRHTDDDSGSWIELEIHDLGPGIAPEARQRLFEPYYTTKAHGTGLGLATSFSIARRHGGSIELKDVEAGACFLLRLPAVELAEEEVSDRQAVSVSGRRILIMEDVVSVRRVLQRGLESLGYEVVAVSEGVECLERFTVERDQGCPFDLVILDLTIPGGIGGRLTVERLRSIQPDVLAIVSSGYSSDPVLADPARFGFRARLQKPFSMADLERVVGEVLRAPAERPEPEG